MPQFSRKSLAHLNTCHPDLQRLFNEVIKTHDCTVIEGHRGKEAQEAAFAKGNSKLHYPHGKHNAMPSLAVDVGPWPLDWNDATSFKKLAANVLAVAEQMGIHIRWGGDWNGDGIANENFIDLPHYELIPKYITSTGN